MQFCVRVGVRDFWSFSFMDKVNFINHQPAWCLTLNETQFTVCLLKLSVYTEVLLLVKFIYHL